MAYTVGKVQKNIPICIYFISINHKFARNSVFCSYRPKEVHFIDHLARLTSAVIRSFRKILSITNADKGEVFKDTSHRF